MSDLGCAISDVAANERGWAGRQSHSRALLLRLLRTRPHTTSSQELKPLERQIGWPLARSCRSTATHLLLLYYST